MAAPTLEWLSSRVWCCGPSEESFINQNFPKLSFYPVEDKEIRVSNKMLFDWGNISSIWASSQFQNSPKLNNSFHPLRLCTTMGSLSFFTCKVYPTIQSKPAGPRVARDLCLEGSQKRCSMSTAHDGTNVFFEHWKIGANIGSTCD